MTIDWNQFKGDWVKWDRPQVVEGVVTHIAIGSYLDATYPELTIRTATGDLRMSANQTQLQRALADDPPNLGDSIRVEYLGEADNARPGYNPTKRFAVKVTHLSAAPPAAPAPSDLV
jgi:hypothetical protein